MFFAKYFWECHVKLPNIDLSKLENEINNYLIIVKLLNKKYCNYKMANVITDVIERSVFFDTILPNNPGLIIMKFGAEWCKPCKVSKPLVYEYFNAMPDNVLCYDVDVDDSFDLYAFFKSKRMINGIPVILAFKR